MELIGRRFGHIRVTDAVGQGGMGDVYAGYDEKLDRKVALKVLHADQRLDAEARERLLREARALSKLDHANICRIHDYLESDDVDVLVLEYIDGRTLQDILHANNLTRGEKLRIAIAIADVLVAAHRVGIIHRDLKPENVMLTKTGEVKVLDFGLARWLTAFSSMRMRPISANALTARMNIKDETIDQWYALEDLGATSEMPAYDSSAAAGKRFLATAVGVTMGTPIYMSPEQARGDTLTTASDMFAFGLVLQALFSGNEPHPAGLSAREVILRAARGETLPAVGLPSDITALINRLKQFAPADRPTAMEAAARLRHLADKTRRIVRRSAIAVVISLMLFGAWRYTVDLSRERAAAIEARSEAERRRAQLENLVEFVLGDLRTKLEPVGRLDILDDVAARALTYVESLNPKVMSAGELARNAKALNQLGSVRVEQGKTPEALEIFNRALRLVAEAVKKEPRNGEALMVLGATQYYIGNSLSLQGKQDDALAHMREYMKAGDTLAEIDPRKKEFLMERAYGHSGVASILEEKGELREALEHYEVSLRVKESIARNDPGDADAQADLSRAYNKVGAVLYKMGDLRGALDHSRREVAICRHLVKLEPQQQIWKQRLAVSMAYLGRALKDTGNRAEAHALWKEELAIENELAARDPANVQWQRSAAITTKRLAMVTAERGDVAGGLRMMRDALQAIDALTEKAPTLAYLKVDAAIMRCDYGRLLTGAGDTRGIPMLRDAVQRLETAGTDHSTAYQAARAMVYLADAVSRRDPRAAAPLWERAERQLQPLISGGGGSPEELAMYMRLLVRRGRLDQARAVLTRVSHTGYDVSDLEQLCAEAGC